MKRDLKPFMRTPWLLGVAIAVVAVVGGLSWWAWRAQTDAYFVSPGGGGRAINRALAKCADRGGEVRLGAGVYLCDKPIIIRWSNITLRGAGAATQIKLADNANCPVLVIGDEANEPRHEVMGVGVSDLTIDGNREQQQEECWNGKCDTGEKTALRSNGLTVRRASDVVVERVNIVRCRSGGVVTEKGCRRLTLRGIACSEHEFDGLACYQTEDSVMEDLFLHSNKAAGISTDIHFNGNIIANAMLVRNGTHGIFMRDSHRNLMQGIVIRDSGRHAVFLDAVDKRPGTGASGNNFVGLTVERSQGAAVRINSADCKPTLLTGCQFFDNEDGISEVAPGIAVIDADRTQPTSGASKAAASGP